MKIVCLAIFAILISSLATAQTLNNVYTAGEGGYACFRIPAIITTKSGTVLAIAEARKINCGDAGDIDLVLKRSTDNGNSWGPIELIWNDSTNTCGNPAPVVEKETGKIILLSTWNLGTDHEKEIIAGTSKDTRRVFVLSSPDEGRSWSPAREITNDVKKPGWNWYATGPGGGIQLEKGKHRGRIVIPCNHITAVEKRNYSHAIFSDDAGEHWQLGGVTKQDSVNESTIAEISGGRLLLNMRNASKKRIRQVATSRDGGESWSNIVPSPQLIEPVCEGNLLRVSNRLLLFSNPASTTARVMMTVRLSSNGGKRWKHSYLLHAGPSAYSSMTILPNGNIGCFFEAGKQKPYEGIVFRELSFQTLKEASK